MTRPEAQVLLHRLDRAGDAFSSVHWAVQRGPAADHYLREVAGEAADHLAALEEARRELARLHGVAP